MIDHDLDKGQRRPGRSGKPAIHDWRLRRDAPEAAEIKWPQLLAFDGFIRERLASILVRRAAEQAAERGLSSAVRTKLWRARLETRRQEFADALELEICQPFSLDAISTPPVPASWLVGHKPELYSDTDVEAGFDIDSATWLRDGRGAPAGVVIQPHYLDFAQASSIGLVECAAYVRGIEIFELPPELGWISPKRQPLLWVPAAAPR